MAQNFINKVVKVEVDRPLGSVHPKYKSPVYEVNYGYIPNTKAADGEEIDVYILRVNKPLKTFVGKIVAVIEREDDVEYKLVAMPEDNCKNVTKEEIINATYFLEKYFKSKVLLK